MAELFREFFWLIFPVLGMGIGAFSIWNEFSRQKKALEVLKVYAEKGAEPPESVLAVLTRASTPVAVKSPRQANPLAQTAFFGVMALGFGGLALWMGQSPGLIVFTIGFTIAGFALAALAASAFVQSRSGRQADGP
jgi:hypothetical protein